MNEEAIDAFKASLQSTAAEREQVRKLVAEGRWRDAEPDVERSRAYATRHRTLMSSSGAESITGATEDFQRASFLSQGARSARAVGYVEVNYGTRAEIGTGFMVSPALFITNRHVIQHESAARGTQVTFFRELDERGVPRPTTTFLLDPDRFALFSPDDQLDYALVALGRRQSGEAEAGDLGFCALSDQPDKHVLGMNTNIVQHPSGWPKMITVRNNILTARTDRTLLYETDTEQGSSGSPVFNDDWQLVALHHWGEPFIDRNALGDKAPVNVNEGVRISAIYRDLASRLSGLPAQWQSLLRDALALGDPGSAAAVGSDRRLSPPRPSAREAKEVEITNPTTELHTMDTPSSASPSSSIRLTVPIELTISIGQAVQAQPVVDDASRSSLASTSLQPKVLARGAEAVQVDQDYGNRNGYDSAFVPGLELPLPQPSPALAKQVAPLRAEEPDAAEGELKYEHFSLKLNKSKRIALFTATNIDGETYLEIDRKTGQPNASEGEVWFKDPRVSASFVLDQSFYSAWSTYFDRGHLTRRTDPTWGSAEDAARANADTFHFTNCSPQHFRFNQSARYWQGLERYVLENGTLAGDVRRRLAVFQGPIFDDKIDLWADDVQIPSSFFKVVVWKGQAGPRAVGLVADQSKLLSEPRRSLGSPQALASVDVNQWRVPIEKIEARTGLDFGELVRGADTIADDGQPRVGEGLVLVRSFESIRL
ncbi:DNA/RNA non-specific endonuclease [Variovorax sp. NFACC27]|uniref:DNA/RNA non-specific endonuclease n=1 Tax=unclassified Variovorax TaxID=663243 RepID=UPI000899A100|nr:endonuclease G [Variovorax sp. NFACC28]SEG58333.1 endonuclease G [Variovorax sp. NFACC29]SFC56796.1 endonuclease G [Variovorax sp. NFACC26]SFG65546.1 endonuclease G [Variovorax sp. NFACC27]